MATVAKQVDSVVNNSTVKKVTWAMAAGDSGEAVDALDAAFADRSVQVVSASYGGGVVTWQGSNDNVNWFTLTAPNGTSLSFASDGLKQVLEGAVYQRPFVTGGDGTTAITVTLMARRISRSLA